MPSATLTKLGTTASFSPIMKRATAVLSDGSAVMMVPDTNISTIGGDDVTGVMKIRFYKSDVSRTTWSLNFTYTPPVAASSSTVQFVGSMTIDTSNNLHVGWAGTDGTLNYTPFTFGSGTWTAGTRQTVVAGNAVTRRWRCIDIDIAGTTNPMIGAYEAKTSAGLSAFVSFYIRLNDGTTWRNAYQEDESAFASGALPIYEPSEDVSCSYDSAGVVSNVVTFLVYIARVAQFEDRGDMIREFTFNVSTGTNGSATSPGTWPIFNQNVAATRRRGWIYKNTAGYWQVAFALGTTQPQLQVTRLTHGNYTAPIINKTNIPATAIYSANGITQASTLLWPSVYWDTAKYAALACAYSDNKVVFGFITPNTMTLGGSYMLASVVFRYDTQSAQSTSYVDTQMRPLDGNFSYGEVPVSIYGQANANTMAGKQEYNFLGVYGHAGNSTASNQYNQVRAITDTFYDPPTNVGPTGVVPNERPTLQVRVQNSGLYPNIKGKIEWNLATNSGFSSNLKTIIEPDSNYRYFGSTNSSVPPQYNISLMLSGVGSQQLFTGTWYMRSRVVSDLGQVSAWSTTTTFAVLHKPAALPKSPNVASFSVYDANGVPFTWVFSDTETTDVQTAYQLLIVRTDTGATVLDTGKVASSVNGATVSLSSTLKDISLQWQVSLWDTDDVQGPFCNPVAFMVGDAPSVRVTSPTDGSTVTTAVPTITWAFTGGGTRTQRAFKVSILAADTLDTFTRTISNNWGTGDSGSVWTVFGTASLYAVASGVGTHQHTAVNNVRMTFQPSVVYNSDQLIAVSTPALSTGSGAQRAGLLSRYLDAANYYVGEIAWLPSGNITCRVVLLLNGAETVLGTYTTGLTHVAGTKYYVRFRTVVNQYQAKVWAVGSAEPGAWQVTAVSSSLPNSGYIGSWSRLDTGNTNATMNFSFDNYSRFNSDIPAVVQTTNWVQSSATTYSFPNNIFVNGATYNVLVEVQDTSGMTALNSVGILSQWTAPSDGDESLVTDQFGITVNWTNANQDMTFLGWRLYRRYMVPTLADLDDDLTATTWVLVYQTTEVKTSYSYKDYLAPLNKVIQYAVAQVADRFGSLIESSLSTPVSTTLVGDRYFFVPQIAIGSIASYQASNVTDDSFTDEVESETLHIIGRGRQVQIGDDLGASGTLTIQLRGTTARADREFFQYLASSKTLSTWMKNPFGDVKLVKFLNVQVKYLSGTGSTEMSDIQVPYVEVITDTPVTRV
jgi:hypothetical protein